MARIRSVHPGLFTDSEFVELSYSAQIFLIGLWTEADDRGAFEWKPKELRMRLRPAVDCDIPAVLAELEAHNQIRKYEHDSHEYGLIRNFCRYQSPRKPKFLYFIPNELRTYVALKTNLTEPELFKEPSGTPPGPVKEPSDTSPEDVKPPAVPQKSEIAPQRERRGKDRRGESNSGESNSAREFGNGSAANFSEDPFDNSALAIIEAYAETVLTMYAQIRGHPFHTDLEYARNWVRHGISLAVCRQVFEQVLTRQRAKGDRPPRSLSYFDDPIRKAFTESGIAVWDEEPPSPFVRVLEKLGPDHAVSHEIGEALGESGNVPAANIVAERFEKEGR